MNNSHFGPRDPARCVCYAAKKIQASEPGNLLLLKYLSTKQQTSPPIPQTFLSSQQHKLNPTIQIF